MITKENYITAHFIDNDRKNIEVLLRDDKIEKVIPFIIEYNPEHPNCQDLWRDTNKHNQKHLEWESQVRLSP